MEAKPQKKDDDEGYTPFVHLDKSTVLQEARVFHEPQINPRKCYPILNKILYVLCQGETLTTIEATEVFFAITKLFQSKDAYLRRVIILVISELVGIAENVIILTSTLTEAVSKPDKYNDFYRSNAIRTLKKITDGSMLGQIER